jgi:hypothetical protein
VFWECYAIEVFQVSAHLRLHVDPRPIATHARKWISPRTLSNIQLSAGARFSADILIPACLGTRHRPSIAERSSA